MQKRSELNVVSSFGIVVPVEQDTSISLTCTWMKKKAQKKLWEQVLFRKWLNPFKIITAWLVFDNFFANASLKVKLYEGGLYGNGTARKDRKGMLEIPVDRKMKRGDFENLYSEKVACCNWLDKRSVTMLFSNIAPRRQEGWVSEMYNKQMGGVDLSN